MLSPSIVLVQVFVTPLEVVQGGGDGSCGTAMLNMSANYFIVDACFPPSSEVRLGYGGTM